MIPEDKFRDILQRLLAKSKDNKVHWEEGEVQGAGESYTVSFSPEVAVVIYYHSPQSAPDCLRASLWITGRCVVFIAAEDGDDDWELLCALKDEARRVVYRIDIGLDVIEQSLKSGDITGVPERAPAPPPPSGEIPF
jgi:hypothetical protein